LAALPECDYSTQKSRDVPALHAQLLMVFVKVSDLEFEEL